MGHGPRRFRASLMDWSGGLFFNVDRWGC
ncbi:hypothetical protein LINGRAHAP2_LOCUS11038 [Linum grandiflorum]